MVKWRGYFTQFGIQVREKRRSGGTKDVVRELLNKSLILSSGGGLCVR